MVAVKNRLNHDRTYVEHIHATRPPAQISDTMALNVLSKVATILPARLGHLNLSAAYGIQYNDGVRKGSVDMQGG